MLAIVLLLNFVANIPAYYQSSRNGCTHPDLSNCPTGQLTPAYVQVLNQLHLSVTAAAVFFATLTLAVSVLYWLVGLLIFWRKSHEWIGLFVSLLLVMFGSTGIDAFIPTAQTPQLLQFLDNIITIVIGPVLFLVLFIFPNGRFTPRWTVAAFVLILVVSGLSSLPVTANLLFSVVVFLAYPLPVIAQVYRYMRVYDAVERQQTKWFVFGVSIVISLVLIEGVLGALAPGSRAVECWYQLFNGPMWLVIWTVLLLSVSIPILRYRLWEIDIIINRTLVYGSLTALLALLYVGFIFALQSLLQGMIKQANNDVAIVVSTLAIAALFQPLRRRTQSLIDRRFYRRKYDATQTLATFNATLRNEVDLTQMSEHLVAVIQETMEPSHISLWLRPVTAERKQSAAWSTPPPASERGETA